MQRLFLHNREDKRKCQADYEIECGETLTAEDVKIFGGFSNLRT